MPESRKQSNKGIKIASILLLVLILALPASAYAGFLDSIALPTIRVIQVLLINPNLEEQKPVIESPAVGAPIDSPVAETISSPPNTDLAGTSNQTSALNFRGTGLASVSYDKASNTVRIHVPSDEARIRSLESSMALNTSSLSDVKNNLIALDSKYFSLSSSISSLSDSILTSDSELDTQGSSISILQSDLSTLNSTVSGLRNTTLTAGGNVILSETAPGVYNISSIDTQGGNYNAAVPTPWPDQTTNTLFYVNKTGASGDLIDIQVNGTTKLRVDYSGNIINSGTVTSGGVYLAPDGTASAPGYSFTNDTNTGIYRIGTDILGFSTGGSERLRVNASGHIGIGTSSPAFLLDVVNDTNESGSQAAGIFSSNITLGANSATQLFGGKANFSLTGGFDLTAGITSPNASFRAFAGHSGTGTISNLAGISSRIDNDGGGTITNAFGYGIERLRNVSSTITNLYGLYMAGVFSNSGTIANTYGVYIGDMTAGTQTNQAYGIYQADTEMRNYFAGTFGIGAATPDARLELAGNLSQSAWGLNGIQLQSTAATYTDSSTAASGTATNAVFSSFGQPTLAASNSSVTTTNAATVYIANAPAAGTNQTITNPYALWVDSGIVKVDGSLVLGDGTTTDANPIRGVWSKTTEGDPVEAMQLIYTATNNTGQDWQDDEIHVIRGVLTLAGNSDMSRGQLVSSDIHSSIRGYANSTNTGFVGSMAGVSSNVEVESLPAAGVVDNVMLFTGETPYNSGIVNKWYGMRVNQSFTNSGTVHNTYGIFLGDLATGTRTNQPFGIYQEDAGARNYFAGAVGIGASTPGKQLSVMGGDIAVAGATLGSEVLTNGSLTSGTSWTVGGDFALSGNKATFTYATGSATLTQASGSLATAIIPGRWYKLTLYIDPATRVIGGLATVTTSVAETASTFNILRAEQTKIVYFKATTSPGDFVISITGVTSGTFGLDNISLKEVQGGNIEAMGVFTGGGTTGIKVDMEGDVGINDTTPTSKLDILPTATYAAAGVSGISQQAHTITLSGADPTTYATFYGAQIGAMTLVGTNANQTVTDGAGLVVAPAIKSTNVALTNTHGILIPATAVSTATNAYGLTVNAPTGATNNYAAVFSGGDVGIGVTAPQEDLHVAGRVRINTWTADGDTAVYKDDTTGNLGVVTSDIRLKKNIEEITGALDIVSQINGYKYHNLDDDDDQAKRYGVMAQELLPLAPELTFTFHNTQNPEVEYYSVHYDKLPVLLLAAVKELQEQVNNLNQSGEATQTELTVTEHLEVQGTLTVVSDAIFEGNIYINGAIYVENKSFAGSAVMDNDGKAYVGFDTPLSIRPVVSLTVVEATDFVLTMVESFSQDSSGNVTGFTIKAGYINGTLAGGVRVNYAVVVPAADAHEALVSVPTPVVVVEPTVTDTSDTTSSTDDSTVVNSPSSDSESLTSDQSADTTNEAHSTVAGDSTSGEPDLSDPILSPSADSGETTTEDATSQTDSTTFS